MEASYSVSGSMVPVAGKDAPALADDQDDDRALDAAATAIQANYRGKMSRQRLEQMESMGALERALATGAWATAAALVASDDSLELDGESQPQYTVWCKVQEALLPRALEGDDDEEAEDEVDVHDEDWQAGLAAELGCEAGTVKQVVDLGVYKGGRAERDEFSEPAFDGELTARAGYGVSLGPKGDVYAGSYAAGLRDGAGALRTAAGAVYVGEWRRGKKHGRGRIGLPDGAKYEGAWRHNKRHGLGTYTYASGDVYVGHWSAGAKHGRGRYTDAKTGVVYEGEWVAGELKASTVRLPSGTYYGAFASGVPVSKGAWHFDNGTMLTGRYADATPATDKADDDAAPTDSSPWTSEACASADPMTPRAFEAAYAQVAQSGPLNVCIVGPPLGGKGTVCERIVEHFNLVHISTGDMLRAAMADDENEDGQAAKELVNAGELVPDELIGKLVKARLLEEDCTSRGWLLDGFPRTAGQVDVLDAAFLHPTHVLVLECGDDVLLERATGRRQDPETGTIYHLKYSPVPEGDDKEAIEARLVQRDDDTEEVVQKRIDTYKKNVASIVDGVEELGGKMALINAERTKDAIWADVKVALAR